jgi:hypothetical protein
MMRLRRPTWKDPRLIVGVVLVLLSILLGALLISRLSATTPVLVARTAIPPGQVLSAENLSTVEVRLGEQSAAYVSSLDDIPEGAVSTGAVQAGEILPAALVGQPAEVTLRPVVVPVDATVAESVAPGATVELWHTAPGGEDTPGEATLLVEQAVVRSVDEGSALGMQSMAVEVLVPREDLAAVLEVLARDERLDVIGIPGAYEVTA